MYRSKRNVAYWNDEFRQFRSPILRYGFSVVCVGVALGLALTLQHYGLPEESPLFNLSIALTTWYAGVGPSVLAVVLSTACFSYFFGAPIYSLFFVTWALIIASFAAVGRHLQTQVEERTRREQEIGKLNQELANRAAELEAANKELESFSYSVSHDLRAPLRHVIGYAELLQKQGSSLLDDKSQRYVQTILESGKRMGNLIDDLLAFSRIGRGESKMRAVDLHQLVNEVVSEFGQQAKGQNISWKISALPVCYGDRSLLKLVVVNLLSNAVKFSAMRRPAKIEIGSVDGNTNTAEIFVRDNGVGFDMQYGSKLFGVFQRLHRADEFEGTGIGLATVQRIVHRHGGMVRAEGVVDQGATFYFSLPKANQPVERTANKP
jgi:signal transduction histidine kinase